METPAATIVTRVLAEAAAGPGFTPTRYPHTYAYDFFRAHHDAFGVSADAFEPGSRGSAAAAVRAYAERTSQDRLDVLIALADGYLAEYGYRVSTTDRLKALACTAPEAFSQP